MFLDDKLQQAHEEHPANYQLFFEYGTSNQSCHV